MTNPVNIAVPWWAQLLTVAVSFGVLGLAGFRLAARGWVITLGDHYEMQVITGSIVAMATGTALARVAGLGIVVALPLGAGGGWALVQALQRPPLAPALRRVLDAKSRRLGAWFVMFLGPYLLALADVHWSAQLMLAPAALLGAMGAIHVAGIAAGTAPGAKG